MSAKNPHQPLTKYWQKSGFGALYEHL